MTRTHQSTGKHEVLPDHDTKLVASVIQGLVFVNASAPDAKHVLVALGLDSAEPHAQTHHETYPSSVTLCRDAGEKTVGRNPAAASTENGDSVDLKVEACTILILEWGLYDVDMAKGYFCGVSGKLCPVLHSVMSDVLTHLIQKIRFELVQRLLAISYGPPRFDRQLPLDPRFKADVFLFNDVVAANQAVSE